LLQVVPEESDAGRAHDHVDCTSGGESALWSKK
jgi:hypothetical protein